ncbi:hypothetical protein DFH09DRAFT_939631, partial [Mycena vulgaris]
VITMYSKAGGKAGAHSLAQRCESIGALSYLVVQTYENSYRRQFNNTRRSDLALGTIDRFAHLPLNSLLALLPTEENGTEPVKIFSNHVEISLRGYKLFETLMGEEMLLCKAVASLNTVSRKGKTNISLVELPEDDAVAE